VYYLLKTLPYFFFQTQWYRQKHGLIRVWKRPDTRYSYILGPSFLLHGLIRVWEISNPMMCITSIFNLFLFLFSDSVVQNNGLMRKINLGLCTLLLVSDTMAQTKTWIYPRLREINPIFCSLIFNDLLSHSEKAWIIRVWEQINPSLCITSLLGSTLLSFQTQWYWQNMG